MNNLQPNRRIASLDALRGFDMLFISGLASLIGLILVSMTTVMMLIIN